MLLMERVAARLRAPPVDSVDAAVLLAAGFLLVSSSVLAAQTGAAADSAAAHDRRGLELLAADSIDAVERPGGGIRVITEVKRLLRLDRVSRARAEIEDALRFDSAHPGAATALTRLVLRTGDERGPLALRPRVGLGRGSRILPRARRAVRRRIGGVLPRPRPARRRRLHADCRSQARRRFRSGRGAGRGRPGLRHHQPGVMRSLEADDRWTSSTDCASACSASESRCWTPAAGRVPTE